LGSDRGCLRLPNPKKLIAQLANLKPTVMVWMPILNPKWGTEGQDMTTFNTNFNWQLCDGAMPLVVQVICSPCQDPYWNLKLSRNKHTGGVD